MNNSDMVILENWSVCRTKTFYDAPEMSVIRLNGTCFGSRKYKDGSRILTNRIIFYDEQKDIFITATKGVYRLGKVDPEYEKLFPNALNRILASLKKDETQEYN